MGGNYTKDIYKQLMEFMERCDSLEKNPLKRFAVMGNKSIEAHEGIDLLNLYDGVLMHDHETAMYHFGSRYAECGIHLLLLYDEKVKFHYNDSKIYIT